MKQSKTLFLLLIPLVGYQFLNFNLSAQTQEKTYHWLSISGKWEARVDNKASFLLETRGKTRAVGYSPLNDANSLASEAFFKDYTSIECAVEILDTRGDGPEVMLFLAAKDFREFYGFKFTGDGEKLNRVAFVSSKIKDITKPPSEKWNYAVSELASKDCALGHKKQFKVEIRVKNKKAILLVDNDKLLQAEAPEDLSAGKVGFSNKDSLLKITGFRLAEGKRTIFEDSFAEDTIKRYKITATRVSREELEKTRKDKKEENKK